MPGWTGSTRRTTLPTNWPTTRRRILTRDGHQCTAPMPDGTRCPQPATDIDHIGDPHDHRDTNLTSLCSWHHDHKSAQQGAAARWAGPPTRRPPEPHPGIL